MKKFLVFLCTVLLVFGVSGLARATVIDFDDYTFAPEAAWDATSGPVPWEEFYLKPYRGDVVSDLNWYGFYRQSQEYYRSTFKDDNWPGVPNEGSNSFGGSYSYANALKNTIGGDRNDLDYGTNESIWSESEAFDLTGAYFSPILFEDALSESTARYIAITGLYYDGTDWTVGETKAIDLLGTTDFNWYYVGLVGYNAYHFNATTVSGAQGIYLMDNLTLNAVPEPATMLLLGAGLIGLAGLGRKKFFKRV